MLKCARTFRATSGRDAFEAFLLHARLLREFLWKCWDPESIHAASEVLAEHYFDDYTNWRRVRGGLTPTLAETKDPIDKQLAHITRERADPSFFTNLEARVDSIESELVQQWTRFLERLSPATKAAFEAAVAVKKQEVGMS